jgi:AraC family transcriptional regulator, transcriptional activator of pobA
MKSFSVMPLQHEHAPVASGYQLLADQDYYRIIWIQDSSAVYCINNSIVRTGPTLYCICPGQSVTFLSNASCNGFIIGFTDDFLNGQQDNNDAITPYCLFKRFKDNFVVTPGPTSLAAMNDLLLTFLGEKDPCDLLWTEITARHLKIFLLYLVQHMISKKSENSDHYNDTLSNKYLDLIEAQFTIKKSVRDYARALYVTPNHLNKIVKDETGFTARQHIQKKIISAAKRELYLSGISMKQVAHQLGFDDIAHFSKFFKKASGISFSGFKKTLSQQTNIA